MIAIIECSNCNKRYIPNKQPTSQEDKCLFCNESLNLSQNNLDEFAILNFNSHEVSDNKTIIQLPSKLESISVNQAILILFSLFLLPQVINTIRKSKFEPLEIAFDVILFTISFTVVYIRDKLLVKSNKYKNVKKLLSVQYSNLNEEEINKYALEIASKKSQGYLLILALPIFFLFALLLFFIIFKLLELG